MEISRNIKAGYSTPAEATSSAKADATNAASAEKAAATGPKPEPRLEQLQEAMRALPEIDMDQVTAIKQALARGELSSDVKVLAHSILAYHRGTDV
jgi:negative regulator of flagellin synthesis FlgM